MLSRDSIWVISPGTFGTPDLAFLNLPSPPRRIAEYRLSELGRYLLCPGSVTFESCLVGCEVHRRSGRWLKGKRWFQRSLRRGDPSPEPNEPLRLTARHPLHLPVLKDPALAEHLHRMRAALAVLDPVMTAIQTLEGTDLEDVVGVCEEGSGQQTLLALQGTPAEKLDFVSRQLLKPVRVTLKRAHLHDGLYELRGFDITGFRPDLQHTLLKLTCEDGIRACVLNAGRQLAFWVDDLQRLSDIQLLQQVLQADGDIARQLERARGGAVRPLRLLFNRAMDIDYSRNRLPGFYREMFRSLDLTADQRQSVIASLNQQQVGVSVNSMETEVHGLPRALTQIAVLHNMRALEALKADVPEVYSRVNARASLSEAGKYYLLESIQGSSDEVRV
jgi:hypothetical protein